MASQPASRNENVTLGYLAAFTLGMVCMTAIVLLLRNTNPATSDRSTSNNQSDAMQQDGPRTFAKRNGAAPTAKRSPAPHRSVQTPRQPPTFSAQPATLVDEDDLSTAAIIEAVNNELPAEPVAAPLPLRVFGGVPQVAGMLSGRATLDGLPPREKPMPLDAACLQLNPGATTQFYVVSPEQGLADVVVYISSDLPKGAWNPAV